ncbi:MAG: PRC-barrel domain-containing protein [Azonexus sp.]
MNAATINTDLVSAGRLGSRVLSASTLEGDDVYNLQGEKLGGIKEFMLDIENGKVRYVVMSFGGFLSLGEKLFAVPWDALTIDTENKRFLMNVDKDRLEDAPGFDPDHWPNMADSTFAERVNAYYGTTF